MCVVNSFISQICKELLKKTVEVIEYLKVKETDIIEASYKTSNDLKQEESLSISCHCVNFYFNGIKQERLVIGSF